MRMLLPLLLLAAASSPADKGAQQRLQRAIEGRTAGEPHKCVAITSSEPLSVIDGQTLAYRTGRTVWINRLREGCRGIRPYETLILETHGSQHCSGDLVRGQAPGSSIPGPACVLGDFTPYRRPAK